MQISLCVITHLFTFFNFTIQIHDLYLFTLKFKQQQQQRYFFCPYATAVGNKEKPWQKVERHPTPFT